MKLLFILNIAIILSCKDMSINDKSSLKIEQHLKQHDMESAINEDSVYKIISFDVDNENKYGMGFEGLDSYTFGVLSMCFLDSTNILITDTYHNNLKIVDITNTGKLKGINNIVFDDFMVDMCLSYNEKIIITDKIKNQFVIIGNDLKNPVFYSFTSEIVELSLSFQFSMYNDSLYLTCAYSDKNTLLEKYDVYNVDENRYYRDNRSFYELLNNYDYNFHLISKELKEKKELDIYVNRIQTTTQMYKGNKKAILCLNEDWNKYSFIVW